MSVRKILNKPRFTIQIGTKLSLFQKKAWNILSYNALKNGMDSESFTITISEFSTLLGVNEKNHSRLQEILRDIVYCPVEWEILNPNKRRSTWVATTLLSHVIVEDSVIHYSYASILKEVLKNPEIYAKIDLLIQKKFVSKHSLSLWEICLDYINIKQTGWISVEQFLNLMGASHYNDWRNIKRKLLQEPIQEINKATYLKISYKTQRTARRISHIKILINTEANSVEEVAAIESKPRQLAPEVIATEKAWEDDLQRQVRESKADQKGHQEKKDEVQNLIENLKFASLKKLSKSED